MESNPEMSGDADFRNPDIRQNRRGFFMPKNVEQEWRVIPNCRETPILETLVRKNQGFFMPKNLDEDGE